MTKLVGIFVVLAIAFLGGTAFSATVIPARPFLLPTVPPDLLPPARMKPRGLCRTAQDFSGTVCDVSDTVTVAFAPDGSIQETVQFIYDDRILVGDLLGAWGDPAGTVKDREWLTTYVWESHYAVTIGTGGLSPFGRVGYLVYGDFKGHYLPWRGFKHAN